MLMDEFISNLLKDFIRRLKENKNSFIFLQPIEELQTIPTYKEKISQPIDLIIISNKFENGNYTSFQQFKQDIDLMLNNCTTFNNEPDNWVLKKALQFQEFFNNNYSKYIAKIEKHIEKKNAFLAQKRAQIKDSYDGKSISQGTLLKSVNNDKNDTNIAVFAYEDERLSKRVKNLFDGIRQNLDLPDESIENIINSLIKSISKRNKSFEQLIDDTTKFVNNHLTNMELKSKFLKKFRKMLRLIQEEQNEESSKLDSKALNIKIDLNENEEKREEKAKLDLIRKDLKNFVDNQKVPDAFIDSNEYPIEPNLKKKIYSFITGIRANMTLNQESIEKNDLMDLEF